MAPLCWAILLLALLLSAVVDGQDYGGGGGARGARRGRNNRGPLLAGVVSGVLGGFVGGWMKQRSLGARLAKEKKQLLDYIHMQEDVISQRDAAWQEAYQKLYKQYEKLETETLERDWEEFKAPDTDGDDQITRQEFAIYVRKYLSSFPELSEADFPKVSPGRIIPTVFLTFDSPLLLPPPLPHHPLGSQFDEFDLNHDGIVSFAEWYCFVLQCCCCLLLSAASSPLSPRIPFNSSPPPFHLFAPQARVSQDSKGAGGRKGQDRREEQFA